MNIAYMTVLEKNEMINSVAVGLSFGERVLGPFSFLIPLGVALSTFGCALSIQFGCTRLCYVSARGEKSKRISMRKKLKFYSSRESHAGALELHPRDPIDTSAGRFPSRNFGFCISDCWRHRRAHRIRIVLDLVRKKPEDVCSACNL